jgi:opacity protein-like surface antigen
MFRLSLVVTTICLAFSLSTSVLAAKPPSNEQLFEMVKALQSRVTVLEKQNTKYQRELMEVHKGAEPARLQLASLTPSADEPRPMRLANPSGPALQPADNWSGLYWGTSFGVGRTSGKTNGTRQSNVVTTGANPSTSSGTETLITDTGTETGAVMDLFLGVNRQLGSRLVAGIQLEGSLSTLDFISTGPNTYTFSGDNSGSFPGISQSEVEWMASVLARGGWLLNPSTLLYGLAGLTYANFDVSEHSLSILERQTFENFGISVGGGIEKKLGPDWSIRGEYRYTNFMDDRTNSTSRRTNTFGANTSNSTLSATTKYQDRDMHIVRIGIARRLGRSEPSAEALK